MDARFELIKNRLETLSNEELQRVIDNEEIVCTDTYNFDESNKTYCTIALAMNLHKVISNPTNEIIYNEIKKRFNPVNPVKGTTGNFYTVNRKNDMISLCKEVLQKRLI